MAKPEAPAPAEDAGRSSQRGSIPVTSVLPAYSHYQYDEPRFSIRTLQHGTGTKDRWRYNADIGSFALDKFKNKRPKVDPELLEEAFEAFHNYDTKGVRTPEADVNPNLPMPIKIDNVYLMIESLGFGFTRREIDGFLDEFGHHIDIEGERGVMLSKNDVDRFLSNTHSHIAADWATEPKCVNPWNAVDRFTNALRSLHSSVGTDVELEHLEHFCCTLGDELSRDEWEEMMRHLRDDKSRTKPKPLDMIVFADRVEQELKKLDVGNHAEHKQRLEKKLTERLEDESETSSVEEEEEAPAEKRKSSKDAPKAAVKKASKDARDESRERDRDRDRDRDRARPDSRHRDRDRAPDDAKKDSKERKSHKKEEPEEPVEKEKHAKAKAAASRAADSNEAKAKREKAAHETKTEQTAADTQEHKKQAKAEPKAEPKPEPKAEPKAQPKPEPKAEPKPEPKAEPKAAPKAEPKVAPKADGASKPRTSDPKPTPLKAPKDSKSSGAGTPKSSAPGTPKVGEPRRVSDTPRNASGKDQAP